MMNDRFDILSLHCLFYIIVILLLGTIDFMEDPVILFAYLFL